MEATVQREATGQRVGAARHPLAGELAALALSGVGEIEPADEVGDDVVEVGQPVVDGGQRLDGDLVVRGLADDAVGLGARLVQPHAHLLEEPLHDQVAVVPERGQRARHHLLQVIGLEEDLLAQELALLLEGELRLAGVGGQRLVGGGRRRGGDQLVPGVGRLLVARVVGERGLALQRAGGRAHLLLDLGADLLEGVEHVELGGRGVRAGVGARAQARGERVRAVEEELAHLGDLALLVQLALRRRLEVEAGVRAGLRAGWARAALSRGRARCESQHNRDAERRTRPRASVHMSPRVYVRGVGLHLVRADGARAELNGILDANWMWA